MKRRRRIGYIAALAAAAAFGLAGCGQESQTASTTNARTPVKPVTPTTTVTTPKKTRSAPKPKPRRVEAMCNILVLSVELGRERGAAGSNYAPLRFTNIGKAACWFYGYPGVSAWSGSHQIGEAAGRDHSVAPERVSLNPGETAHARIRITDAANYPHDICKPAQAEGLMVFPPGSYGAKVAPDRFTACAGNVALLHVRPVFK